MMSDRTFAWIVAALATVSLVACGPDAVPGDTAAAEEPTAPSDRIQVPATVQETLGLTFATVERRRPSLETRRLRIR